jgi:hypothetical protein
MRNNSLKNVNRGDLLPSRLSDHKDRVLNCLLKRESRWCVLEFTFRNGFRLRHATFKVGAQCDRIDSARAQTFLYRWYTHKLEQQVFDRDSYVAPLPRTLDGIVDCDVEFCGNHDMCPVRANVLLTGARRRCARPVERRVRAFTDHASL